MDLNKVVEDYVMGTLEADKLPGIAAEALAAGLDSPSLWKLASVLETDDKNVSRLFIQSLHELGIRIPTPCEVGKARAVRIARDVVSGAVPPYEGAKLIWSDIYVQFPELTELLGLVGSASEYEDDVVHREEYAQSIIDECRLLIDNR